MKFSRKNLGRAASAFLATAMLAAFAAVPASAEAISSNNDATKGTAGTGAAEIASLDFKSDLLLPTGVEVPSASIEFTLTPDDVDSSESVDIPSTSNKVPVSKNQNATTASDIISMSASNTSSVGSTSYTGVSKLEQTVSISLSGLTFNEVGVYKYALTWKITSSTSQSDFTPSSAPRTVYLYVARLGSQYKVTGAVMVNGESYSSTSKSDGIITNYFMLSGSPDDPSPNPSPKANELTLASNVTGIMGNETEPFDFTVKIDAPTGKTYNIEYEKYDANQAKWIVDSNTPAVNLTDSGNGTYSTKVSLSHNQRIHLYGLSAGDKYTITADTKYASEGYTSSVSGYTDNTEIAFDASNKVEITYTYTRNAITPTGVVVSVAPYALLVLVAAAAGFVFLRKRRED